MSSRDIPIDYDSLVNIPRSQLISYSQTDKSPIKEEVWSHLLNRDFGRKVKFLATWEDTYKYFYDRLNDIKLTFSIDDLHSKKYSNLLSCLNSSDINYTYNTIHTNKSIYPIYSRHNEPVLAFTLVLKGLRSPEIAKTFKCLLDNKIHYYIYDLQEVLIPELMNILLFIPTHPIITTLFPVYGSALLDAIEERVYQADPNFVNLVLKDLNNPYITPYIYDLAQQQVESRQSSPTVPDDSRSYLRSARD